MVSIEDLADLLNNEINSDFMDAVVELWEDGESPFDPEHPAIEPVLQKIVDALNDQEYDYDESDDDDEDDEDEVEDYNE